ncbi:hypothetical protein, partial [Flavobacterium filum]|uniref:hypothetical protein n=1 Tax=Flavobacterium filum TaxID=370974 RepID=UPI0023F33C86
QRHIGLARPLRNLILKKNFNPGTAFCGLAARNHAYRQEGMDRPLQKNLILNLQLQNNRT